MNPPWTFQSAPPRGGDCSLPQTFWAPQCFNPRPRVGATHAHARSDGIRGGFNPRPRVGATVAVHQVSHRLKVSIRAPAWGRPMHTLEAMGYGEVSIRAPAWGRLEAGRDRVLRHGVSIRAPAWGRLERYGSCTYFPMFQSAPPRGGDLEGSRAGRGKSVSIRAPAWGRQGIRADARPNRGFNPRPRVGATCRGCKPATSRTCFNPRPRVGATSCRSPMAGSSACFNPRPRVGATRSPSPALGRSRVSIRAPAWGRRCRSSRACCSWSFNPRPRVGATRQPTISCASTRSFNPRPRVGATPMCASLNHSAIRFNPRPRVGATAASYLFDKERQIRQRARSCSCEPSDPRWVSLLAAVFFKNQPAMETANLPISS